MDCQRVRREVPTTICVICWSTAAAKMVLATSSPSSVCHLPPTAFTNSSSSAVLTCDASSPEITCTAIRSALMRAAMRAARRITDAFPGAPVTATMIRSVVSHSSPATPLERRNSKSSSSVSSATNRNESSRSATRFSVRKNPFSADGTLCSG